MVEILERCLHEAKVFERASPNKSLVEQDVRKEGDKLRWVVLAAGISEDDARRYFSDSPSKAENAGIPLQVAGGGQGTILLQMRPIEWPGTIPDSKSVVMHYAPGERVPMVEVRRGRLDFSFDPTDGRLGLFNIRWEIDPHGTGRPPLENWLGTWHKTIGYNPAHAPSHLHFNSQPKLMRRDETFDAEDDAQRDLRLAVGDANPLAFLLSFAAWVRRNLAVGS
jgi:hypothetical protein